MIKKVLTSMGWQIGIYTIPFLITPILVRNLDAINYGVYGTLTAYIITAQILVDWGFNIWGAKYLSKHDAVLRLQIFRQSILPGKLLLLAVTVVLTLAVAVSNKVIGENILILIPALLAGILLSYFNPLCLYIAEGWINKYLKYVAVCRVWQIPIVYLMVRGESDLWMALCIMQLGGLAGNLFALHNYPGVKQKNNFHLPLRMGLAAISKSSSVVPGIFFTTLYTTAVPLILSLSMPLGDLGVFIGAYSLTRAVQSISGPLQQWYLSARLKLENKSPANYSGLIFLAQVLYGCVWIAVVFLGREIVSVYYFHSKLKGVGEMLLMQSPIVALGGIGSLLTNKLLSNCGSEKTYSMIMFVVSTMGIALIYIASEYYSGFGASLALVFVEIIIIVLMMSANSKWILRSE